MFSYYYYYYYYLRFLSAQPDTSLHCKTTNTRLDCITRCACSNIRWYSLCLPTEMIVDLSGWLHAKMVYLPADSHPFKY